MKRLAVSGSHRRFAVLVAVTGVLVLVALVATSAAVASGGNSANAKLCQKGGWQTLQQSNGAPFTSQSNCVSYAAGGGTLFKPQLTAIDEGCNTTRAPGYDLWRIDATGFTPNSTLTINNVLIPPDQFDSSGSITVYFIPDQAGATDTLTFTDGSGVTASVTFGPTLSCS